MLDQKHKSRGCIFYRPPLIFSRRGSGGGEQLQQIITESDQAVNQKARNSLHRRFRAIVPAWEYSLHFVLASLFLPTTLISDREIKSRRGGSIPTAVLGLRILPCCANEHLPQPGQPLFVSRKERPACTKCRTIYSAAIPTIISVIKVCIVVPCLPNLLQKEPRYSIHFSKSTKSVRALLAAPFLAAPEDQQTQPSLRLSPSRLRVRSGRAGKSRAMPDRSCMPSEISAISSRWSRGAQRRSSTYTASPAHNTPSGTPRPAA